MYETGEGAGAASRVSSTAPPSFFFSSFFPSPNIEPVNRGAGCCARSGAADARKSESVKRLKSGLLSRLDI
jgi:hypothetical protein